ncbi:MAG: hypothetical protein FJ148_16785 [Deltaproteobacteria bacterium]|nr:hypothetical protein [Deltaproteobacteria bacterium]
MGGVPSERAVRRARRRARVCRIRRVHANRCGGRPRRQIGEALRGDHFPCPASGRGDSFVRPGGCGGNGNNFATADACQRTCGIDP